MYVVLYNSIYKWQILSSLALVNKSPLGAVHIIMICPFFKN